MIKVPDISAFSFYTRDSFIDNKTSFRSVENSASIIQGISSQKFIQQYVSGIDIPFAVWTSNGAPVIESNLSITTYEQYILTDTEGRDLYLCTIKFNETGCAVVEIRDADYISLTTYDLDVLETMPDSEETPSIYLEYSNNTNDDLDYYFVDNSNQRIYYGIWFTALNISPITESEIENFEDSNNDPSKTRSISNDGFSIKTKGDNRFLRMLQKINDCKYIRINGIEYTTISGIEAEQIGESNESILTMQVIRRKGVAYQPQIGVCALTDDGLTIIDNEGNSVILNYKPTPL